MTDSQQWSLSSVAVAEPQVSCVPASPNSAVTASTKAGRDPAFGADEVPGPGRCLLAHRIGDVLSGRALNAAWLSFRSSVAAVA